MRICLVSMNVHPVLVEDSGVQQVGGAEVQQVQLARLFRSMGHDVSFVTAHDGPRDDESVHGFDVYRAYRLSAGLPVVRYMYPRWTGVWSALRRASAHVYYTRGAGLLPGLLCLFRSRASRDCKVIFAAAHDSDFDPSSLLIRYARDRWLYRYGIKRVDAIITQTVGQNEKLRQEFGRPSVTVPNFLDAEPRTVPDADRQYVLWVGRLCGLKRPLRFLQLARGLPQLQFVMIGPRDIHESSLYDETESRAASIPNLHFLGFRPFHETDTWFDRARVLVSTSEIEGFPNVFLQAMRRGVPVVSFVDPDGMIGRYRLGCVVTDEVGLAEAVVRQASPPFPDPRPIVDCFVKNFSPPSVRDAYARLFETLRS